MLRRHFARHRLRPIAFGLLLTASILPGGSPAHAQSVAEASNAPSITGRATDATDQPLAGAHVDLVDAADAVRSATTDRDGRYAFAGIAAGTHRLRLDVPGHAPVERDVVVSATGTTVADLQLGLAAVSESIRVTGDRALTEIEAQRALTPGSVTVLDGDDNFRRFVGGLADMLRFVPGVWAESASGSDELYFSSRGSNLDAVHYDKNGIKLLQDGLPITTADGNNHNRVVDPLSARYATVARGANALTYGASTLGGAIDFTSPTAAAGAPLSVFLSGGSHGALDARLTAGAGGESLDGLITLETKQWDGYRDHSDQERWGVYANAGWRPTEAADLRFFATYVDNDQRLPGALTRSEVDADPDQASDDAVGGDYGKVVKTLRLATRATWLFPGERSLMAGVSFEEQSLFHPIVDRVLVDFDGPGPNPPVEVFSLLIDTDHRDLGAVLRYDFAFGAHDLLAGVNYGEGTVEGGNYRNASGRRNGLNETVDNAAESLELFVTDRWHASERFTVELGVQYVDAMRDVETTNATTGAVTHPSGSFSAFNPRVGAILALDGAGEVYGNVSRLFEAPTTFQMQDDVRGGNALLDPMHGVVAEVGWRSRASLPEGARWTWELSGYYARIRDEILSVDDPQAPGNSLVTNVDETIHAGIEALVRAQFELGTGQRLEPQVSFSWNDFAFDGDPVYGDNRLPAAPRYVVRGELLWRNSNGIYAGPTFDFLGERYADFANTYEVDAHALLGLRAGLSLGTWEIFAEGRNLLDEEYVAAVNVFNEAAPGARVLYPGSPRSFFVGGRYAFGK